MLVLNRFHSFIKQHSLFKSEDRILLALSGGRDSVLMAHLFKQSGFNFGIAHCHFNLRKHEADADEQFTSNLASELEAPFFSTRFNTESYAKKHRISVQMAARDLRYSWLEEIRNDFGYQYIALAHHQNDTVETMLLNLTRGTGIAGLHGILPKRDRLIRPLLFLNRDEITEIIRLENISFRDDSSNNSSKYARNKIRLEVIPKLKELNPKLEETFEANRGRFAELEILLNERLAELKQSLFKEITKERFQIELASLKKLHPLKTLLFGLFHPYGFTEPVLHDLIKSWNGQPGKIFESHSYQLLLDRRHLILSKKSSVEKPEIQINASTNHIEWNKQHFKIHITSIENFTLQKTPNLAQVDFDLLKFPLKLRSWKSADVFHPLGMKGKKKLSDFFTGQKIPLNLKNDIGILEDGTGEIIWIAGFRLDDRFKTSLNTKKVFIFGQQTVDGK